MFLLRLLASTRSRTGSTVGLFGTAMVAINLLSTSSVLACQAAQPSANSISTTNGGGGSVYDFSAVDIDGNRVELGGDRYRGHVLIIVNVASKCGYTDGHYAELNQLLQEYGETKGLRILAFPCNQFGNQEPDSNAEIARFAREKKGARFDLFSKIYVNGDEAHPLWKFLKERQGGTLFDAIKWNFTKFIVDKNGQPVERHGPQTSPLELRENLEKYF
ncbi:glutathione peroxidase-like [Wyeomyia smithii]|uniref:glutathione peroxidase-like n=1 Tax=Wyeomyia smithii TaxID=174621 RepID=UPI0024680C88|nr:glutathione peroxidase-like [Wyeomyia smithii]XP_055524194.1 glutathione peroxidase-like [Wyeomyia smithii]